MKRTLATLGLVCICMFAGFISGYFAGTGTLPSLHESKAIAPPEISQTTAATSSTAVSKIDFPKYQEGWNCVDFAWQAARQLAWKGQPAAIVALEFEEGLGHTILLVPTIDAGWIYMEPQTGDIVKPRVSGLYGGRKIVQIRVLKLVWTPIDKFLENPIFEEVE